MSEGQWYLVWEAARDPETGEWTTTVYHSPTPSEPSGPPAGGKIERSYDGKWLTVYAPHKIPRQDTGTMTETLIPIRAYLRL